MTEIEPLRPPKNTFNGKELTTERGFPRFHPCSAFSRQSVAVPSTERCFGGPMTEIQPLRPPKNTFNGKELTTELGFPRFHPCSAFSRQSVAIPSTERTYPPATQRAARSSVSLTPSSHG